MDKDGVSATRDILTSPREKMAECLDENGIGYFDIVMSPDEVPPEASLEPDDDFSRTEEAIEDDPRDFLPSDQDDSDTEPLETPISLVVSASLRYRGPSVTTGGITVSSPARTAQTHMASGSFAAPSSPFVLGPGTPRDHGIGDSRYVDLLSKVISLARRGSLPACGSFGMSELGASFSSSLNMTDPSTPS